MLRSLLLLLLLSCFSVCAMNEPGSPKEPFLLVLGTAQDAGYPQAGCRKTCCKPVWEGKEKGSSATCLALVDPLSGQRWLFEATPDFPHQLRALDELVPHPEAPGLAGIFLTHAHIGHYAGLMHLGREVMGGKKVPVFAMPRMTSFLSENGPWSQLVKLDNIALVPLQREQPQRLTDSLSVTPLQVPHRDEFSETVGFLIESHSRKVLFIPDIDKWARWDQRIVDWIKRVDLAFLDATFFAEGEIPGRNMSEIPHPFVEESMALMKDLSPAEKARVHFIHFNHTNPLLMPEGDAAKRVEKLGFRVAREGMRFSLDP